MGEVWRARDSRLDRTVAIKVLPSRLSSDPRLRERFEREARAISALSHPHICTLYDVGSHDGVDFLVMEFLDGESLADRLAKGPLPIEQVLRYGVEIAQALERAHKAGIVHRDLKPGNVVLTRSGAKLLDFGLAKFSQAPTDPNAATAALTHQKPLTEEGSILGTFQYMAPEQIEGRDADARTDIFALGALLYEMATGRRAFDAKTKASLIASILDRDPAPISTVQPLTPSSLERVIRICLAKDPDDRWQSAHDVAVELKWVAEAAEAPRKAAPRWREMLAWSVAALALIALAAVLARTRETTPAVVRTQIVAPDKVTISYGGPDSGSLTISPDGQWLTFAAETADGKLMLWLRRASDLAARPIPFTENARFPFWGPDSRSLAFFADGKLKRIGIDGGPATVVCEAVDGRSGSWNRDGVIIFEPHWRLPLHRVNASGGKSTPITKIDEAAQETTHRWAAFLPDGNHFLFLAGSHLAEENSDRNAVYVASLDSPARRLLLHARSNVAYAAGHLLFVRDRFLLAQRFDTEKLELIGEPRAVAENVNYDHGFLRASFAASDDGTLVYQPAGEPIQTRLYWLDRATGKFSEPLATAGAVGDVSLSPAGNRVVTSEGEPGDLYLMDLERKTRVRITSNRLGEYDARWSADGKRIAFASDRNVDYDTYVMDPAQPNSERVLARIPANEEMPTAWSPDGQWILLRYSGDRSGQSDLYVAPAAGGAARPLVATPANETEGVFSPDGKWVAFVSDESGQLEVYVAPFSDPLQKTQVSTSGGQGVKWSADGRELTIGSREVVWAVPIETTPRLQIGTPARIEVTSRETPYDKRITAGVIAPDGKRFLVALREGEVPVSPIVLVQNWTSEEKK